MEEKKVVDVQIWPVSRGSLPHEVMNPTFLASSSLILIMSYADLISNLENTLTPLAGSSRDSILGNGYASHTVMLLSF